MGLEFFVPGTPRPQGSKTNMGRGRFVESSKHLPAWRKAIIQKAQAESNGAKITGPVIVEAEFIFPRPKRLHNKPTEAFVGAPDVDKLQRAVGDALTLAEVIEDDRYITRWRDPRKRYAEMGEKAGAHITITEEEH